MGRMAKYLTVCLVVILALCSLIMVESASGQTIPKPAVPEFTAKYNPSYNAVTTTDPYTGENSTTTQNLSTIDLKITNQQYTYTNGSTFTIFYNIRIKGSFEYSWTELYHPMELLTKSGYNGSDYHEYHAEFIVAADSPYYHGSLPQTESTYTTFSLPTNDYPSNGKLDIQVMAMLGVNSTYFQPAHNFIAIGGEYYPAIAYVKSSDWSNTQIITISETSTLPTSSPSLPNNGPTSPPNTNSDLTTLTWIVIGILVVSVISLLLYVRHLKRRLPKN